MQERPRALPPWHVLPNRTVLIGNTIELMQKMVQLKVN